MYGPTKKNPDCHLHNIYHSLDMVGYDLNLDAYESLEMAFGHEASVQVNPFPNDKF